MRQLPVLLLLVAVAAAGPVGEYLGYHVGLVQVHEGTGRDSAHITFPIQLDTVFYSSFTDTTIVIAETLYGGSPAWLTRNIQGGQTRVDTAVESGDTLLRAKVPLGFVETWTNVWQVPFAVGNWWRLGLEGTWYFDINGDSLEDTLTIWADTARVTGIEDVVVPWDSVPGCWRVEYTLKQAASLRESIFPIRETSDVRVISWYKDSLGAVKDSFSVVADAYFWFFIWLPAGTVYSDRTSVLTSLYTGVAERPALPLAGRLAASPNPFGPRTLIALSGNTLPDNPTIDIHDALGRLVRWLPGPRAYWDGRDARGAALPPGVYFARGAGSSLAITKLD